MDDDDDDNVEKGDIYCESDGYQLTFWTNSINLEMLEMQGGWCKLIQAEDKSANFTLTVAKLNLTQLVPQNCHFSASDV